MENSSLLYQTLMIAPTYLQTFGLAFDCDLQETQNFPMAGFVVKSCPIEDPWGGAV